jgi:AcrR family transcriptional regulator
MIRTAPDTRQEIISEASRLFAESGFKGTSLQDIARVVGVSKAALLYHFATKEAILAELMAPAVAELVVLDGRLAGLTGEDAQRTAAIGFAELAVRFRGPIAALHGDIPELIKLEAFGTVLDLAERLLDAMAGRSADPAARLAATLLLSGLPAACAKSADMPDDELRPALVAISARTLGVPLAHYPSE